MVHLRVAAVVVALGLTIGVLSDADGPARAVGVRPTQAVGVTLSPGPGGEAQAYEDFLAVGADAIEAPQPWSTLEPAAGRYRLAAVGALVRGVEPEPTIRVMAIPAAIETTRRSVPRDLRSAPWDGRRMIDRYRGLLRRLAPRLSRQVRFISIANEADVYLNAHPDEVPAFLRFARAEIAEVHRLVPWAKVGVTVTDRGLTPRNAEIGRALARLGDATIVTYYPLVGGFRMRSPRAPLTDIPRLVRIAGGHPLVLQEAGYSSAPRLGGSPARQARFVHDVFAAARRFPREIPFLSFYTLFDPPARDCPGTSEEVTFLCSLGLHRGDGRPKPAWSAFRAGLEERR